MVHSVVLKICQVVGTGVLHVLVEKTRSILFSHSAITSRFILLYVSTQIVTNEDELFWAVDVNMGIPQWITSQENMCNQSIMYGTASNTSLQQFDSLNLALGAFCTISVSDFYIEAKTFRGMSVETGHVSLYDTPTTSCPSWIWPNHKRPVSPQAKWKSTHDLTLDPTCWPQGRGRNGLCRCQCIIDLPHEDTKLSARISWLLPKETQPHWRSEQMVIREEAEAKFSENCNQGPHDEVYTNGSKMSKRVGAAVFINHQFQNDEATCSQPLVRKNPR